MPSSDDLISGRPTPGATSGPAPIGVPAGYEAPPYRSGRTMAEAWSQRPLGSGAPVPPPTRAEPYMDGDDWLPANASAEEIARVQRRMEQAGLLTADYRLGVWDDTTRTAYRDLLSYANAIGTDDSTALDRWITTGMGTVAEPEVPRPPLVARVSNPDDLKAGFRATFKATLGVGEAVDEAGLDRAVAAYHQKQIAAQQSEYNAQETGGVVTAPPDFETFAATQAKMADPTAFDSRKVVAAADFLSRKLRGEVA